VASTIINPSVLYLEPQFPTDDPLSLLGETLIHEFVHTPQGGGENQVSLAPKEAKASAVELFFAERMGDRTRADVIEGRSYGDPVSGYTGADRVFSNTYSPPKALYEIIDQDGPDAAEARRMTVELISKNAEDYSRKLKQFAASHP
jgi:hypothetical protein